MISHFEEWIEHKGTAIVTRICKARNHPLINPYWTSYLVILDYKMIEVMRNNKNFLDDIDGWNGCVTYYRHELDLETKKQAITIGHDYVHSWDMENYSQYDLDYIRDEINKIREEAIILFKKEFNNERS
jgi:hypothetical protein